MKTMYVRLEAFYDYRLSHLPDAVVVEITQADFDRWAKLSHILEVEGVDEISIYEFRCKFFKLVDHTDRENNDAPVVDFDFISDSEAVVISAEGVTWRGLATDNPVSSYWFTAPISFEEMKKTFG